MPPRRARGRATAPASLSALAPASSARCSIWLLHLVPPSPKKPCSPVQHPAQHKTRSGRSRSGLDRLPISAIRSFCYSETRVGTGLVPQAAARISCSPLPWVFYGWRVSRGTVPAQQTSGAWGLSSEGLYLCPRSLLLAAFGDSRPVNGDKPTRQPCD